MHCRRATQLISESMDRELSGKERLALWVHLRLCTACRRYRRQLRLIRQAIRRFGDWIGETAGVAGASLPAAARHRIREALASAD